MMKRTQPDHFRFAYYYRMGQASNVLFSGKPTASQFLNVPIWTMSRYSGHKNISHIAYRSDDQPKTPHINFQFLAVRCASTMCQEYVCI